MTTDDILRMAREADQPKHRWVTSNYLRTARLIDGTGKIVAEINTNFSRDCWTTDSGDRYIDEASARAAVERAAAIRAGGTK